MKLVLGINPAVPTGYQVVDPNVNYMFDRFDAVCSNSEATEIVSEYALSFFPYNEWNRVLTYWTMKLRRGGVLKLQTPDYNNIVNDTPDIQKANELLFNNGLYRGVANVVDVVSLLENLGYVNIGVRMFNTTAVVTGQKS